MKKLVSLILGLAAFSLISCSKTNDEEAANKLVIGTSADNPPYEFINEGQIVGFDIDIAREIAKELQKELIVKNLDFPGLLPSILSHNVDMVLAALTVTPERLQNVDFSIPYTSSVMAILYREDTDIKEGTSLKNMNIGVQFGTTWEEYAKKLVEGSEEGSVKSLANNLAIVQELVNKNVDIVVMENLQVSKFIKKYPTLKALPIKETKSDFAVALPKNSELTAKVNEIIKKLEQNGTLEQLRNKWLSQ